MSYTSLLSLLGLHVQLGSDLTLTVT